MRKVLITLAAAASALAVASPAAAQYYPAPPYVPVPRYVPVPQPQPYTYNGYSTPYGYNGYNNGYGYNGYSTPYGYNGYSNPYGYNGYNNNGYNNGYGYNNYGQVRALQVRIDQIQRDISRLSQRRAISRDEYNGLVSESRNLEQRLRDRARYGLNPQESYEIQTRIARLEQHVRHEVIDGRSYSNNGGFVDRDRDGRNDRYEDDRGTRRDR